MRYYIIAGEASGDLHGSNLVKQLKNCDDQAVIRAWGGGLMEQAGAEIVKHYRDLAFMGFSEVLMNLKTILNNLSYCKKSIESFKPDAIILIDYPGFNLRIAKWAHNEQYKVLYYISPQIWAWKQSRVKQIKAYVDEMFVILPFEKEFYKKFGVDVHYVGHPLIDALEDYKQNALSHTEFKERNQLGDKPIIAILPGSRKQEISAMLPIMLKAVNEVGDFELVIAGAPSQEEAFYKSILKETKVKVLFNSTYEILTHAHAALVTSGTATLETAIFKIPQVVCYKGGLVSYIIARALVKVKYISLVNLIMDKMVVKELIQNEMNVQSVQKELNKITGNQEYRDRMLADYDKLYSKLGGGGASKLAAREMFKTLQ